MLIERRLTWGGKSAEGGPVQFLLTEIIDSMLNNIVRWNFGFAVGLET